MFSHSKGLAVSLSATKLDWYNKKTKLNTDKNRNINSFKLENTL